MWLPEVPKSQVSVTQEPLKGMTEVVECPRDHLPLVFLSVYGSVSRACLYGGDGDAAPPPVWGDGGARWTPLH